MVQPVASVHLAEGTRSTTRSSSPTAATPAGRVSRPTAALLSLTPNRPTTRPSVDSRS